MKGNGQGQGQLGQGHQGRQVRLPKPQSHKAKYNSEKQILSDIEVKKIIREMQLKVTNQRMAILKILATSSQHFMAQEIFDKVHSQFPEIGFATVYRFLKKLTDFKYVTEVRMGGLPSRYEMAPTHHHDHMSCTQCGKVVEFENFSIEALQEKVAEELGFTLTGHVLELYGICPECQNERK